MFALLRKRIPLAQFVEGLYDIHSHLLPGVDDGSPSAEKSLELLQEMEKLGFKGVCFTPHIMAGTYRQNDATFLRRKFDEFTYRGTLRLQLGAEYFLDERFLFHLEDNPLVLGGNHLLIEFPMNSFLQRFHELIFEIMLRGYIPVVAHPERYRFLQDKTGKELLSNLTASGCKLQLNLLSLTGYHGPSARLWGYRMLEEGCYTFVGTDTHSHTYLKMLRESFIPASSLNALEKLKENNAALF